MKPKVTIQRARNFNKIPNNPVKMGKTFGAPHKRGWVVTAQYRDVAVYQYFRWWLFAWMRANELRDDLTPEEKAW